MHWQSGLKTGNVTIGADWISGSVHVQPLVKAGMAAAIKVLIVGKAGTPGFLRLDYVEGLMKADQNLDLYIFKADAYIITVVVLNQSFNWYWFIVNLEIRWLNLNLNWNTDQWQLNTDL